MAGNNSCVVGHTESAVDWRGATDESGVAAQPLPTFDTPRDWPNASVSSLAARVGVDSQSLQQLVTSSPWSDDRVWRAIRQEVIPHLEPLEAWIVDETGWLKQGQHSVGVSHQYCGAVGKQANCQVSVELAVSDGGVAAPLGGQLYLPQSWTQDRERCTQVGVPEEVPFRSKPELGLELIRQALDDGVPPAPVLGDCVYGDSPEFREGVRQLGMEFFLQTSGRHKAWTHPVTTERKRVRRYVAPGVPPAQTLAEITATFPAEQWKACSWQAADGHARRTRLAWCEVYLQHKLREGDDDLERVWLVVDWPAAKPSLIIMSWLIFISRLAGPVACA